MKQKFIIIYLKALFIFNIYILNKKGSIEVFYEELINPSKIFAGNVCNQINGLKGKLDILEYEFYDFIDAENFMNNKINIEKFFNKTVNGPRPGQILDENWFERLSVVSSSSKCRIRLGYLSINEKSNKSKYITNIEMEIVAKAHSYFLLKVRVKLEEKYKKELKKLYVNEFSESEYRWCKIPQRSFWDYSSWYPMEKSPQSIKRKKIIKENRSIYELVFSTLDEVFNLFFYQRNKIFPFLINLDTNIKPKSFAKSFKRSIFLDDYFAIQHSNKNRIIYTYKNEFFNYKICNHDTNSYYYYANDNEFDFYIKIVFLEMYKRCSLLLYSEYRKLGTNKSKLNTRESEEKFSDLEAEYIQLKRIYNDYRKTYFELESTYNEEYKYWKRFNIIFNDLEDEVTDLEDSIRLERERLITNIDLINAIASKRISILVGILSFLTFLLSIIVFLNSLTSNTP